MPDDFRFPDPQTQVWIPYPLSGRGRVSPIARIADGVALEAASAQVSGILAGIQAKRARAEGKALDLCGRTPCTSS